jgi:hypothetical protein
MAGMDHVLVRFAPASIFRDVLVAGDKSFLQEKIGGNHHEISFP